MKKWIRFTLYVLKMFFKDDCANRAASLAYTTLLSLVPIVMITFWILSLFPAFSGIGDILKQFIVKNFVAHSAHVISTQLDQFLLQMRKLSWGTLLALAIVSILMIYEMVNAFNSIWQVKSKNIALSFSFYSLVLLFTPIVFGIFIVFISYLSTLPFFSEWAFLEKPLFSVLPYLTAFILFTFFNWALPSCTVPLRNAAVAGFITMVLFEIVKYIFGLYMSYFPTYKVIYGALAAIPIFLLWIYTSWVIILLGAVYVRL